MGVLHGGLTKGEHKHRQDWVANQLDCVTKLKADHQDKGDQIEKK